MTPDEHNKEVRRLERLIAAEDAGKKSPTKSLAEKVAHNRERNRLQEKLRQFKLSYFELMTD
jgi:hypothetical protein